ncbi:hypothetical protein TWF730_009375 [Orbilia blumenaviensis]|uniref:Nephrocystin 3-like N-terminal domain-containing protein n=1 Tax=Orbilia blumenaviensis TaxID=1796055 RepID=A0AAV9UY52_9PEZI
MWACAVCEQLGTTTSEFTNENELVDHITTTHNDSVESDEIPMFVAASLSSKPVEMDGCPLCTGPGEGEDLLEHIAHCVHDFSLNCLPLPSDSDAEDDYFDIDSRNSDSQNTPSSCSAEERDLEGLAELATMDTPDFDEKHKISESTLKTLAQNQTGPKGISVLEWKLDEATEDLQVDVSTDVAEGGATAAENPQTSQSTDEDPGTETDFYGPNQRARYRIAWLCQSKMDATIAEALFDSIDLVPVTSEASGSFFDYILGRVGSHIVVLAWASESSSRLTEKWCLATEVTRAFRSLEIFLHVGTAAGLRASKVYLSDVVVGLRDNNKPGAFYVKHALWGGMNAIEVGRSGRVAKVPPNSVIQAISSVKDRSRKLRELIDEHEHIIPEYQDIRLLKDVRFGLDLLHVDYTGPGDEGPTCELCHSAADPVKKFRPFGCEPNIYYSGIGCVEFGSEKFPLAPLIRDYTVECLCVDTQRVLLSHFDTDGLIPIRGIARYTDTHSDIRWKRAAASAAAVYAKELLRNLILDQVPPLSSDYDQSSDDGSIGLGFLDEDVDQEPELPHKKPDVTAEVSTGAGIEQPERRELEGGRLVRCLFRKKAACIYTTSSFGEWSNHIKKHLIESNPAPPSQLDTGSRGRRLEADGQYGAYRSNRDIKGRTRENFDSDPPHLAQLPSAEWESPTPSVLPDLTSHSRQDTHKSTPRARYVYPPYPPPYPPPDPPTYPSTEADFIQPIQPNPVSPHSPLYPDSTYPNQHSYPTHPSYHPSNPLPLHPLSWICGFRACQKSYEGPTKFGLSVLRNQRDDKDLGTSELLRRYRAQYSAEEEDVFESKLLHIYTHVIRDKWDLDDYEDEEEWTEFFDSLLSRPPQSQFEPFPQMDPVQTEASRRMEVSEWLNPRNFLPEQEKYNYSPTEGTLLWFPELPEFKEWEGSREGKTLLCTGPPGIGKTYITAMVYKELRRRYDGNASICVVYCDPSIARDGITTTLRCIIGQLLPQSTYNIPDTLYKKFRTREDPSIDELDAHLELLVSKPPKTFILIDDLDTFKTHTFQWARFCDLIKRLEIWGANLFLTSRIIPAINKRIQAQLHIEIGEKHTRQDISLYLRQSLPTRYSFLGGTLEVLQGIFALAVEFTRFVVMSNQEGHLDIQDLLYSPGSYKIFYDNFMTRIIADASNIINKYAQTAIWLVGRADSHSTGFSILELKQAIQTYLNLQTYRGPHLEPLEDLISWSHGLLTYDEATSTVILFNPTAYIYFEQDPKQWYPSFWNTAGELIVQYLCSDTFKTGACLNREAYDKRLSAHPYYRRAAKEWGRLAKEEPEAVNFRETIMSFLQDDLLVASADQVLEFENSGYTDFRNSTSVLGIHLAARFGIGWAIGDLARTQSIDARDYYDRTPLDLAIENGNFDTFRALVKHGASLENIKGDNSTALIEAICLEDGLWFVDALLNLGADANGRGILSGMLVIITPLNLAILQQASAIVDILIRHGANVNLKDDMGRTPLICAVVVDNMELAGRLIESGADLEATHKQDGITALGYAALTDQKNAVEFLIKRGANVNAWSAPGGFILDRVRRLGSKTMADFLLQMGGKGMPREAGDEAGEEAVLIPPLKANDLPIQSERIFTGKFYSAWCCFPGCRRFERSQKKGLAKGMLYDHQMRIHPEWTVGRTLEELWTVTSVRGYNIV